MKDLKQFIGKYQVDKTLRFELRPVGKTEKWLNLTNDKKRADDYVIVKGLIDRYHKVCIRESLDGCNIDWNPLAEALEAYHSNKDTESLSSLRKSQKDFRAIIAHKFTSFPHYNELDESTPNKLIKDILPECVKGRSLPEFRDIENVDDAIKALSSFKDFALYFDKYQVNRKNLYTDNKSSVAYRIVHDNFPKFMGNIKAYDNIRKICPEIIDMCATKLEPYLKGITLDEVFNVRYFNSVLIQDGIDLYNTIIGGASGKEGEKSQGINELVNSKFPRNKQNKSKRNNLFMKPLFKQLLFDKSTYSFVAEKINDNGELVHVIEGFHDCISEYSLNVERVDIIEELQRIIKSCDPNDIFVDGKKLNRISEQLFNDRSELRAKITSHLKEQNWTEKKIEKFWKEDTFSFADLFLDKNLLISDLKKVAKNIDKYWKQFEKRKDNIKQQKDYVSKTDINLIKHLLDGYKEFLSSCSNLNVDRKKQLDSIFYITFNPLFDELKSIVPLYDRVRNFLSQKPSNERKFKLKFDNPQFAKSWDNPQEKSICLFRINERYLIGVVNSNNRSILKNLDKIVPSSEDDKIEYLDYHQGGSMAQNLITLYDENGKTKKAWAKSEGKENPEFERILQEHLPSEINRIRKSQSYINNKPNFSKDDLARFIDYYQQRAKKYYEYFSFSFKDACDYESFKEFTDDVEKQAYKIKFVSTSYKHLKSLVKDGKLYLFDIKNKDYEPKAHGKKNLHTLYWEQLFSEENINNKVIKLNAKSELFCRPMDTRIIRNLKSHKKGSILLNRKDKDGKPIPERTYQRLYKYVNGKISEDKLSDEEKHYLDKITTKVARYTITKDKRYTEDKYFIHISITFNANAPKTVKAKDFDKDVKDYITFNPDINIIGIDRGERNLLYLSLINQEGEILDQKSLNVINDFDYQAKLENREKERDEARKSWQPIGKITDLKKGYLSAAIHEITRMMIENNAIIVLEDLNKGFKKGRFKFEKQVYQLFEKKLIEKLNYLCSKDFKPTADGGVLHGYQLTNKFVNFKNMTKQNGFLFYVRPDYTSSIDPVTGFVAHFNFSEIRNTQDRRDFFMNMESITFTNGHVEFVLDYNNFNPIIKDYKNVWAVSSLGKRIIWNKKDKKYIDYYPTKKIIEAFKRKCISLDEGTDIKALLSGIDSSAANEEFYSILFEAFRRTVQMRNTDTKDDYIISPAIVNGKQYSSLEEKERWKESGMNVVHKLPIDADANGAYHIALKGLYLLMNPQEQDVGNEEWFKFVVEKPFKKK